MTELGTKENPFTHGVGTLAQNKWCLCSQCSNMAVCTPFNDFYAFEPGGPLWCSSPCALYESQRRAQAVAG